MTNKLPEGWICSKCGYETRFPLYVYAHWRESLLTKCEKCGKPHSVQMGIATPRRKPKSISVSNQ